MTIDPACWRAVMRTDCPMPGRRALSIDYRAVMPQSSDGMDAYVVLYCPRCDVHWYRHDEPAKCTDPQHPHHAFDIHRHRSLVVLPDGTAVVAVSFDPA